MKKNNKYTFEEQTKWYKRFYLSYEKLINIGLILLLLIFSGVMVHISNKLFSRAGDVTDSYLWKEAPCIYGDKGGSSCSNPKCDKKKNPNDPACFQKYDWAVNGSLYRANYGYRNCTDWAQFRAAQVGITVPPGLGNGGEWYYNVDAKYRSSTPQTWDLAVQTGTPGHVAFVEEVSSDGKTILISEYNHDLMGHGDTRWVSASNFVYIDYGIHPSPAKADIDGDGTPDASDTCPLVAGPKNNRGCPLDGHTVSGDFSGDGKADSLSFYDYGDSNLGVWMFSGSASGIDKPKFLWSTGTGQWDWSRSRFVSGDFNGDGKIDALSFYDYGNDNLGAWLFPGNGNGVDKLQHQWSTGNGEWNLINSSFYAGNFNGDRYTDVIAMYNYSNDNLGAWLFPGGTDGIGKPQNIWKTGDRQWNSSRSSFVVGDFDGDSKTDLVGYYDYGNNNLGAWLFAGNGNGVGKPNLLWQTGEGQWKISDSRFYSGDFNGDGKTDVTGLYNYGSGNLGGWLFPGISTGIDKAQFLWKTGDGQWNSHDSKYSVGDFNGDGKAYMVGFYNYGNSNLGGWLFAGNVNGVDKPQSLWRTGDGQWDWRDM